MISSGHIPAKPIVNALALKTIPIFSGLSQERIENLVRILRHRYVRRGETIMQEGDVPDYFYMILSGKAKVVINNQENREFIISFLKTGDFFGEMGMLDDKPRSATVVAMTPCELILVGKSDFETFLSGNHEIAQYMLKSFSHRMRTVIRKIESLAMMDVYGRVARVLLDNSRLVDGERVYQYRLSKQEFAEMVGASREMVTRVLKHLEEEGFIELRNSGKIVVNDFPREKAELSVA